MEDTFKAERLTLTKRVTRRLSSASGKGCWYELC